MDIDFNKGVYTLLHDGDVVGTKKIQKGLKIVPYL